MAALMLLSAVPDVLRIPDALLVFNRLGYPPYLLLFLGTAKILGVAAVLIPGVSRIKEWAFAGLTFDVTGALYSHLSIGDPPGAWMPAVVALALIGGLVCRISRHGAPTTDLCDQRVVGRSQAATERRLGLNV